MYPAVTNFLNLCINNTSLMTNTNNNFVPQIETKLNNIILIRYLIEVEFCLIIITNDTRRRAICPS